ncbi:c3h4 type zinc finger protein [Stagonosporopsis vannaccii]|nr:c3h4 type zinc finger protein [Stagonosporopsis vannaccii]
MAASDFSAPYPYIGMSTGQGPQGAGASGPWPPVASPLHQRQRWEYDPGALHHQPGSPYLPPPHVNPHLQPNYQQSPYPPYTGHGWPSMQPYPPSPFSITSHQPRPPPAIRSGHVDALMNPSRSGHDMYREPPSNYFSHYLGAHGYPTYLAPPQPAGPADNSPSMPFHGVRSVQVTDTEGVEQQSTHTIPLHPGPSGPNQTNRANQHQRRHADRSALQRRSEHTEPRPPRNVAAQARRPDRSSSPRTSTRRSYNRYSADLSLSSTSSDVEEAAARSPPSDRLRHQSRESRLRFFRQAYDPNVTTEIQIQALKANLPKLLLGDLPKDTSPTCDICAKDYSAIHVQPSEEEEVALTLPCGHNFGEFCISQWFETCKTHKNKVTCPMCRKQLIEAPRSPYTTDRFDSGMFSPSMYIHAARSSQSFRDLLSNELQAQYARA